MLEKFALEDDVFTIPLISRQLLELRLLGYVYSVKDHFKIFHFARGLISSMVVVSLVSAQFFGIWIYRDDMEMLILMFGASLTFVNIITRIIIFYNNNREYRILLRNISIGFNHVLSTSLPGEMKIYKEYLKYIRSLSYAFWCPCAIGIFYMGIEATYFLIFNYPNWELGQSSNSTTIYKRRLPTLYYLHPMGNLGSSFFMAFIAPYATLFISVMSLVSWHTFNASLMRYISFRLDIVKYKISNIQEYVNLILQKSLKSTDNLSVVTRNDQTWRYVFTTCVKDYYDIVSFSKDYEEVTSTSVFLESTTISVLLCVLLYIISRDVGAGYGVYNFWCMATIQILWVYFWHGNEIVHKSDELTNAVYSIKWYEFPVAVQKDILILMMLTMRPIRLKAGFFYMNSKSLATILKTSYSYFTLLRNFAE